MKKKHVYLQHAWIIFVLLFLYLPILLLAIYSFTDSKMIGSIRGFSLENYKVLFTTGELRDMMMGTILLALVVAVLATILGTLGAIGFFYSKKRWRRSFEFLNQIPVVNADVVTGFSVCVLLIVFLKMDKSSFVPLVVGLVTLSAPFVYLSVVPRLKQMDPELYEAALDLGYGPLGAIGKVILPQLYSGILSGFMMSITLTLDDYFISTYTKPATFDTISTYVVNATKGAQTEIKTALWALSTVIFLCVALSVIIANISKKEASYEK